MKERKRKKGKTNRKKVTLKERQSKRKKERKNRKMTEKKEKKRHFDEEPSLRSLPFCEKF